MLQRARRLVKSGAFHAVYRRGAGLGGRYVVVRYLYRGGGPSRIGFVVSRKVGKAVVRNRLRRRLREAVRRHLPELRPGFDVVVLPRPAAGGAGYRELEQDVWRAVKRAGLVGGFQEEAAVVRNRPVVSRGKGPC